jgi:hypothetical protein
MNTKKNMLGNEIKVELNKQLDQMVAYGLNEGNPEAYYLHINKYCGDKHLKNLAHRLLEVEFNDESLNEYLKTHMTEAKTVTEEMFSIMEIGDTTEYYEHYVKDDLLSVLSAYGAAINTWAEKRAEELGYNIKLNNNYHFHFDNGFFGQKRVMMELIANEDKMSNMFGLLILHLISNKNIF